MADLDLGVIGAGTVLWLVLGAVYYGVLGDRVAASGASLTERPAWQVPLVELARGLVVSVVLAALVAATDVTSAAGGLALGAGLWVGFPLVLWTGAMFHDGEPWSLAALHAGDWLVKLLVLGAVAGMLSA